MWCHRRWFIVSETCLVHYICTEFIPGSTKYYRPSVSPEAIMNFTFAWPCIVTYFFVIKPTRCTNFTNLFWTWNSTCFGQFLCPSSAVYSLYTQQWCMSHSCRAGAGWNWVPSCSCSTAVYKPVWLTPLLSVQWINSWWWTDELSETYSFIPE